MADGQCKRHFVGALPLPRSSQEVTFEDFCFKANARILPWLSYMCHIRSIAFAPYRTSVDPSWIGVDGSRFTVVADWGVNVFRVLVFLYEVHILGHEALTAVRVGTLLLVLSQVARTAPGPHVLERVFFLSTNWSGSASSPR